MNSIEKYLRTNIKLSTILYFSTLVYFVFFIYSDIYLIEPIIDIPEIIDSLMFFWFFVYNLYSNNDPKGFKRQKEKFVI